MTLLCKWNKIQNQAWRKRKKKKRSIYCSLGADDYGEVDSKGAIGVWILGFFPPPLK